MKIADPVLLSLFMRNNKKVQHLSRPLAPAPYSIFNTKCIGVIDPEGPEKYNNTEMKSGRLEGQSIFIIYFVQLNVI